MPSETVETEVWEPDKENPPYLRLVQRKDVKTVLGEIVAITGEYPRGCSEGLHIFPLVTDSAWPKGRIIVFPVRGGNEGHYTHVEVRHKDRDSLVLLGKTFDGFDAAWEYAKQLARLLDA